MATSCDYLFTNIEMRANNGAFVVFMGCSNCSGIDVSYKAIDCKWEMVFDL